ncbi:Aste57867_2195 [Aphanomyces stellatus]|uniref:Aste57867_2195 protein n=1 Tax=Aphanomyces stellatus TaxID=120398 RepID=A0A485K743_9STRA|nr:hypothetical protein As57867_002190 [Aphanomyces stellatus]VFT79398.1 Aste57867_2195 [Aphanomyces stellatus]
MVRALLVPAAMMAATAAAASLRMLSLNTLCADDSFSPGWGTRGEMARRDALVAGGMTDAAARQFLLSTRYQRVAAFLREAQETHNALALQEMDLLTVAGGEYFLKYFDVENGPWRVACNVASPTEQEMVLVNTDEIKVLKNASWTENGVVGCSATVQLDSQDEPITLMSFHMKAGFIRDPVKFNDTLVRFMNTMPQDDSVVVAGGDFNVNIPNVVDRMTNLNGDKYLWAHRTADNETDLGFTTQHEFNFLGAYDGFITRNYDDQADDSTFVWAQGLMPKYLGFNASTYGQSPFSYADGAYPSVAGNLIFNDQDLGEENWANMSISDHMAVSSSFFTDRCDDDK